MKKYLFLSTILLSTLLLSGCNLTNQTTEGGSTSSASTSVENPTTSNGNSSSVNDSTHTVDLVTGDDAYSITGSNVEILSGEDCIILVQETDHALIYPVKGGTVQIKSDADTWTLNISYDFFTFQNGTDYTNSISDTVRENFRGNKEDKYTVGTKNSVKLDVEFSYFTLVKDEEEISDEVVSVSLEDLINNNDIDSFGLKFTSTDVNEKNLSNYVVVNEDGTLSFTDKSIDKEFEIEISYGKEKVTQNVLVNDGYNAYDTLSFKELFEDNDITLINVLRSFDAELQENQYYYNKMVEQWVPFNTNPDNAARKYQGSVYYRKFSKESFNSLTINGNYMSIDGQNLPKHIPFGTTDKNGSQADYSSLNGTNDIGYNVDFTETQSGALGVQIVTIDNVYKTAVNVQEGMFRIFNSDDKTKIEETAVTFKNLDVRGNSESSDSDDSDDLYANSGGFIGVINNGSNVLIENSNFTFFTYGTQVNFDKDVRRSKLTIKDSKFTDTWGPNIVAWRAHEINLENSELARSGGPAIWCISELHTADSKNDWVAGVERKTIVNIDSTSKLDNYTTASSGWFKAHNISGIEQMSSLIEGMVGNYSSVLGITDKNTIAALSSALSKIGFPDQKQNTIYNSKGYYNFVSLVQETSNDDSSHRAYTELSIKGQKGNIDPAKYKTTLVNVVGTDIYAQTVADIYSGTGKYAQVSDILAQAGIPEDNIPTAAQTLTLCYYLQTYLNNMESDTKYIELAADMSVAGMGYIGAVLEVNSVK